MKTRILLSSLLCVALLLVGVWRYRKVQACVVMAVALRDVMADYPADTRVVVLRAVGAGVADIQVAYDGLALGGIKFQVEGAGREHMEYMKISIKELGWTEAQVLCGDFHVGVSGTTYILYLRRAAGRWVVVKKSIYEIS